MKLIQTIHRASGHSAKVFYRDIDSNYVVIYYYKGSPLRDYFTSVLQDAIETAQLELMILQDGD